MGRPSSASATAHDPGTSRSLPFAGDPWVAPTKARRRSPHPPRVIEPPRRADVPVPLAKEAGAEDDVVGDADARAEDGELVEEARRRGDDALVLAAVHRHDPALRDDRAVVVEDGVP